MAPTGPTRTPVPAPALQPLPERADSLGSPSGALGLPDRGAHGRTGVDTWSRPQPPARRHASDEDEYEYGTARREDPYGEEPAYGPVLAYTAGWYGIPAVFYVVWLVTLASERQSFAWRQFVASLPWLFAAIVLSLAIAGLLRWAIVGWRALTLSFAAAVIGAGVTTIAHSLAV